MAPRRSDIRRAGALAFFGIAFSLWLTAPARAQSTCVGDCDDSGTVIVNEVVTCVNVALDIEALSVCPACSANGTTVQIADLVTAVNNDLDGCPGGPTSTPKPTSAATNTPTVTPTTHTTCPLQPGKYTITSQGGGVLKVYTSAAFPFPPFGDTVVDVSAGDANCIHSVVVPSPGGFTSPVFCVPSLGATTLVAQTGCGVGQIASKGGADYTVTEKGDTSYTSATCNIPFAGVCTGLHTPLACCTGPGTGPTCCPGPGPASDSSILVRVNVGDGVTDVCTGGGTVNTILSIPVFTTTWVAGGATGGTCPDVDGTYNPGTDSLLAEFPQILDFTTDSTNAMFEDLDGDGCFKSGVGPVTYTTGMGSNGPNGFCLGAGNPIECCTGLYKGTCTGPQGTCMDLTKLNATIKECKKADSSGKHVVCTADGECGTNGPCVGGACYKDANLHCSVDGDCKECQGTAGAANPTFCSTDGDCSGTGPCIDISPCRQLGVVAATTVNAGTIGTSGGPTYDLLFETVLPNSITGPEAPLGATCANPPVINFNGMADRCIVAP